MLNNKFLLIIFFTINTVLAGGDFTIEAENADIDDKNFISIFTGNVVLTDEAFIIYANKIEVSNYQDGKPIVTAFGDSENKVQYKRSETSQNKLEYATSKNLIYQAKSSQIVMRGDVEVKWEEGISKTQELEYNVENDKLSFRGEQKSSIIKFQFSK